MVRTPLYCPRFVGRDRELAALADLARRAASGESVFAFVSGEAGAGKTRLIEELRRHLPRGMRGVRGTCLEYAPTPLGSVLDVVAALEAEHGLPAIDVPIAALTDDDRVDKRRLFERVTGALRAAGAARPFVVVLDDAHWADTATLELLQFLIGTLHDARILLVVAYRTDEVPETHPLHALVARAARSRTMQSVELAPLSAAQVHELIDATLPKSVRVSIEALRDVRERSEGNPLFAEEFLKTAVDGVHSGGSRPMLPPSLRGLLLERFLRLPPDDIRLLETAALIGRRFGAAFLARIAGCEVDVLAPFLRRAIDEHFLVEDEAELGWFTFRHALTRDTILSRVLAIQARAMHAAIAQAIEAEPDRDAREAELADHYWHAARFTECARYAERAGDLAKARHAYAEAAALYERALACRVSDERALLALHEKAAAAYASLGSPRKELEHRDFVGACARAVGDAERLIENDLAAAMAMRRIGETDRAFVVLRTAAELSRERGDDRLLVKCAVQLAQAHMIAEEWEQVEANLCFDEALIEAADPRDRARFFMARAALRLFHEDLAGWESDAQQAAGVARAHGAPDLTALALLNYGIAARTYAHFEAAADAFREATEIGRVFGETYVATYATLGYINVLFVTGRLHEAREQLLEVLAELPESTTIRILIAQFAVALATVLRDDSLYERCFSEELLEEAFSTNEPMQYAPLTAAVAEHRLAEGDTEAAAALVERMTAALPGDWIDGEVMLAVAAAGSQRDVDAARERFHGPSAQRRNPFVRAMRELFEAYAAARFGHRAEKLDRAAAAARAFHQLGAPLLEAEAYELAEQSPRAVAIGERVGAWRFARRVASRAPRRSPATQLTAREREIVELALNELSNRAIADELSLSERTVEAHVAAAYRKLGVRSRRELFSALRTGTS